MPMAKPVVLPMVATPVALLVHVPLGVMLASVMLAAGHTVVVPVIAAGNGLTVITVVL